MGQRTPHWAYLSGVLVCCAVAVGLGIRATGGPEFRGKLARDQERAERIDRLVRNIRHQTGGKLDMTKWQQVPKTLSEVRDSHFFVDPLTKKPFFYRPLTKYSFEVCVDFELDGATVRRSSRYDAYDFGHPDHGVGRTCFVFKINGEIDWPKQ